MKSRTWLGLAVILVAMLTLGWTQQTSRSPQTTKWEYLTYRVSGKTGPTDEELNRLGAEGWELSGAYEWTGHLIFKRKK